MKHWLDLFTATNGTQSRAAGVKIEYWFILPLCLLTFCASVAAAQPPEWKADLKAAIRSNDVAQVASILSNNSLRPGVALDDNSVTPLHLAAFSGSLEVADWLVSKGVHVDAITTQQGHTPLIIAAGRGHLELAKLLLVHSAKIDQKDSAGLTPLLWAIHQDQTAVARYLIDRQADINAAAENGRSALMMAAERGNLPLVKELLGKGAVVTHTNEVGNDALIEAAEAGRTDVVGLLIHSGCLVDRQNGDGWTALMKAAALGNVEIVRMLCDAGADPIKKNKFGRMAVDYAKGIPGTSQLSTIEDYDTAVQKKVFAPDEQYYVMARKRAGVDYEAIVKELSEHSRQWSSSHPKAKREDGPH